MILQSQLQKQFQILDLLNSCTLVPSVLSSDIFCTVRFPLALDSGIEFCSLEDYVSFHNEVVLKFAFYLVVIIFFFRCELK